MIHVCNIILFITAIIIMIYDYKIQKIPMWLLVVNYSSICFLVNYWLLLGLLVIVFVKIKDFPIDWLYIFMIGYLIIINNSYFSLISISILLIHVMISVQNNIKFMITLELVILLEIFIKEMFIL